MYPPDVRLAEKERGMAEMSGKFRALGGEVYVAEEEKAEAGFGTGADGAA